MCLVRFTSRYDPFSQVSASLLTAKRTITSSENVLKKAGDVLDDKNEASRTKEPVANETKK